MNCGIYQIKNVKNNKCYIGSSRNILRRKYYHFYALKMNKHPNKILQNSFNKYGEENFSFRVLELCEIENLLIKEQEYLDRDNPLFNIRPKAESNLGHKFIRSKEQQEQYRMAHRLAVTDETRAKMREYKHMLGKTHSSETKRKMSESAKKPIIQLKKDGTFIKEWSCAKEAATTLQVCRSAISSCANGNRKHAYKFIWKFKEQSG